MKLSDMVRYDANMGRVRERLMLHIRKKRGDHWIWRHSHRDDGQFYLTRKEVTPLPLQVHPKGKHVSSRRLMYLLAYGEIPDGTNVKTACAVPACMNPEHLVLDLNEHTTIQAKEAMEEILTILNAKPAREV